jgi:2-methylisocitrate lyase-like PEP mutase family enzyme
VSAAGEGAAAARPPRATIRSLLDAGDGIVVALGAHDGLQARLAEQAGARALYHGSYAVASAYGVPDTGLVGRGETVASVNRMAAATRLPIIADADTGYGDEVSVARTVTELERAGASAIQIEDQVWPKRCGHMAGKQVIPVQEMVAKVEAAVDARDPETVVIARTDALQVDGIDAAVARCEAYAAAGADLVFVDAPDSHEMLARAARAAGDTRTMANMVETGVTPLLPVPELEALGFALVIFPATHVWAMAATYRRLAETILRDGSTEAMRDELLPFAETNAVLGLTGADGVGTGQTGPKR